MFWTMFAAASLAIICDRAASGAWTLYKLIRLGRKAQPVIGRWMGILEKHGWLKEESGDEKKGA